MKDSPRGGKRKYIQRVLSRNNHQNPWFFIVKPRQIIDFSWFSLSELPYNGSSTAAMLTAGPLHPLHSPLQIRCSQLVRVPAKSLTVTVRGKDAERSEQPLETVVRAKFQGARLRGAWRDVGMTRHLPSPHSFWSDVRSLTEFDRVFSQNETGFEFS